MTMWARSTRVRTKARRWHLVTEDETHETYCVSGQGYPEKYSDHYEYVTEEPDNVCRACDPSQRIKDREKKRG